MALPCRVHDSGVFPWTRSRSRSRPECGHAATKKPITSHQAGILGFAYTYLQPLSICHRFG